MTTALDRGLGAVLGALSRSADGAQAESPEAAFRAFVASRDGEGKSSKPPTFVSFANAPAIASVGYHLGNGVSIGAKRKADWIEGLRKLQRKDPFPLDREAFFFRPVELLGISVGISASFKSEEAEHRWLVDNLQSKTGQELMSGPPSWPSLLYRMGAHLIGAKAPGIQPVEWVNLDDPTKCLLSWCRSRMPELPGMKLVDVPNDALLERALTESWDHFSAAQATIARSALRLHIRRSIEAQYRPTETVVRLLQGVEPGLRRWRYDDESTQKPVRWEISGEKHVQDFLWLVLRPSFPDLIDEEFLPKFGFKQSKPDFAIPSLELLIEVKFVSKPAHYKERFEEIGKDVIEYFHASDKFKRLIVVLYDDVPCPEYQEQFVTDLKKIDKVEGVVIIQRPGRVAALAAS